MPTLQLQAKGLFLPLRTTFKQASSVRNHGESIWCRATMNGLEGFGEGCPRIYVTGENVEGGLAWLTGVLPKVEAECQDLASLKNWMDVRRIELDEHPAAWCAVETALLDLFASKENLQVERLLGLSSPSGTYQYTAVLGDGSMEKFTALTMKYLATGFTDFKVKVGGELEHDQNRIAQLRKLAQAQGLENVRIRLDANNFWADKTEEAIGHLSQLNGPFLGIEEPAAPKDYSAIGQISRALDLPIILDESLCSLSDLKILDKTKGKFIANLKVSRLGGVLRSLEMVTELQKRNWPTIVGAHVGETSILTRAGMCVAQAAGESLLAHEGGFGEILLEKDMTQPSLSFGVGGKITIPEDWPFGWGLKNVAK